jgi:flagellar protein FliS
MALNKKAAEQYQNNTVFTATPEELTLMLYNGAVKFIKQAEIAMEDNNIEKVNENSQKAQNIIRELMSTLDMKYEVSSGLYNLYDYFLKRLIDANIKKDVDALKEVEGFMADLRDSWEQAMKIARKQQRSKPQISAV